MNFRVISPNWKMGPRNDVCPRGKVWIARVLLVGLRVMSDDATQNLKRVSGFCAVGEREG